jgi:transposase InsO family protein
MVLIRESHQRSRELYGVLRITADLRHRGIRCSHNRVHRLMRAAGIRSRRAKRHQVGTQSAQRSLVAPNLLNQQFAAGTPNHVWVADLTYIPTREGWLYLAAVVDLGRRKVVGWAMASTLSHELPLTALRQAIGRERPTAGIIHHSDRGTQYTSHAYQGLLRQYGFIASMSRKGNCYDNACMESFFSTLKTELVNLSRFRTRAEARQAVFEYIEVYYNRSRLHSALGYLSPRDYEHHYCTQLT